MRVLSLPPFDEWLAKLRDRQARARIVNRMQRLGNDNPGDHKSVGSGIFELRIDCGPGYRVYYAKRGNIVVVLLCGGDKSSQNRDIERAKVLALEIDEEWLWQ
jgi:putative addiction module killer protein